MNIAYPLIRPSYYKVLFKEIISFILHPNDLLHTEKSVRHKIYDTIGLFILKLILIIIVASLLSVLSPWFDPENVSKANRVDRFSPLLMLLVFGFILPLVEEICFRLS